MRHCWVVDPEARRLDCHRLEAGEFLRVATAEGGAVLDHADWPGLRIELSRLWSGA